ncbi:MAG: hypothetical protein ACE5G0_03085 [Rhodothermales bacterium]
MEQKKEIAKLVNVLRRTARMAQQAHWTGNGDEAQTFCVKQYNRVLARLIELDESTAIIFEPLAPDASLTVVALACRQLAAYYEDEVRASKGWGRVYGAAFDSDSFKDFWRQSARDIEDLGEFIRENIETWAHQHRKKTQEGEEEQDDED